jgi:hypothetical protein
VDVQAGVFGQSFLGKPRGESVLANQIPKHCLSD